MFIQCNFIEYCLSNVLLLYLINIPGHGPSMERWTEANSSHLQISNNRLDNNNSFAHTSHMNFQFSRSIMATFHHCNTSIL